MSEPRAIDYPRGAPVGVGARPPKVVIGVGNDFRRDDGVGWAVAKAVAAMGLSGVEAVCASGEPTELLDVWRDRDLAVIVDAVLVVSEAVGRVMRFSGSEFESGAGFSSHALSIPDALALGEALGRVPGRLVVIGVGGSDFEQGPGLSDPVAAAVPAAVEAVLAELSR